MSTFQNTTFVPHKNGAFTSLQMILLRYVFHTS